MVPTIIPAGTLLMSATATSQEGPAIIFQPAESGIVQVVLGVPVIVSVVAEVYRSQYPRHFSTSVSVVYDPLQPKRVFGCAEGYNVVTDESLSTSNGRPIIFQPASIFTLVDCWLLAVNVLVNIPRPWVAANTVWSDGRYWSM